MNLSYKEQMSFVTDRPGHDRSYAIDAMKIHRELGRKVQESFETGIHKAIQWVSRQPRMGEKCHQWGLHYKKWIQKQY